MASPISDTVFHIRRSSIDGKAVTFAGIDRGCSLTKAMYLPKDVKEDTQTHYAFHCVLYSNDDFLDCLHYLKVNARLPEEGAIHVTGAGCDKYREKITEILGLAVQFIPEALTIFNGVHLFIKSVTDLDECFFPEIHIKKLEMKFSEELMNHREAVIKRLTVNNGTDPLFPFILVTIGSALGIHILYGDGTNKPVSISMIGGKTLLGLGSVIAGIQNYDELMEAAEKGIAGNVDTTMGDVMRKDKSEYGEFPLDLTTFPLGKIVDQKRTIEFYDKNDRAASAVRLLAQMVATTVQITAYSEGISRVVFGGHGTRGESFRRAILESINLMLHPAELDIKFLRTGGTGAFGAMLIDHKPAAM